MTLFFNFSFPHVEVVCGECGTRKRLSEVSPSDVRPYQFSCSPKCEDQ